MDLCPGPKMLGMSIIISFLLCWDPEIADGTRDTNLGRAPFFCKRNGYPTIATSQLCDDLIPENGIWIWMMIYALVESDGPMSGAENARYVHHY